MMKRLENNDKEDGNFFLNIQVIVIIYSFEKYWNKIWNKSFPLIFDR